MNNIILTTTEPSAFGGAFDDKETRKECASRTKIIFDKYNDQMYEFDKEIFDFSKRTS